MLNGGLPRGGAYFVIGPPGAGKTVLALQMSFQSARAGLPVVFLTTLSESHDKLLAHAGTLSFYDRELVGNGIELINLQSLIETSPEAAVSGIVSAARSTRAGLVAIDGFSGMGGFFESDLAARQFLYELSTKLGVLGITLLVGLQGDPLRMSDRPELTVADGVLALYREPAGAAHRRYLEAAKVRGVPHLRGVHSFTITPQGLTVYPQQEALPPPEPLGFGPDRAPFDIPALDAMLGGGLNQGTLTVLAGGPGTGKTLAGLHFLKAGVSRGEPGLLLGFREAESQLLARAASVGFDLGSALKRGQVQVVTYPPVWLDPDVIVHDLRNRVEAAAIRRLVIDSADELERSLAPERAADFLAALVAFLRGYPATTLLTHEAPRASPTTIGLSPAASVLAENLVLFQAVVYRAEIQRILSVLKMRFSDHDRSLREFTIGTQGIRVLGPDDSAPDVIGLIEGRSSEDAE